jgi:hypothetical protein
LFDWLKEGVTIKVETAEMAYGLQQKSAGDLKGYQKKVKRQDFGHSVLESREAMSHANLICPETQQT